MTVQEIINYITTTPFNTNRAILNQMFKELLANYDAKENVDTPDIPDIPEVIEKLLVNISAAYAGGNVPTNSPLDELLPYLTVKAIYDDGTSLTLDAVYSLNGEINEGVNIITVSYEGFTTTFEVVGEILLTSLYTTYSGDALSIGSSSQDIQDLGVLGFYSDGSVEYIADYTLSNSKIVEGNNPVIITVGDKSTTLNINGVGEIDPDVVDLVLFTGQSNMSGRGVASNAPVVPDGCGYWYKNPSLPNMSCDTEGLYNIKEPFGLETLCTGSLVSAFASTYYKQTRVPIVACAGAIGGQDLYTFLKGGGNIWGPYISTSVSGAKSYLASIGKTIRRAFVVFNQGENDAQHDRDKDTYISTFNQFWSDLKKDFGFKEMFIIGLGQYNGSSDISFDKIKQAHLELAANNADITFVSDKFTEATGLMKDEWHYTQPVYNAVGKDAATNIVYHYNKVAPIITTFSGLDASTEPIKSVGSLDSWNYTLKGATVRLDGYTGEDTDVFVNAYYSLDGQIYKTIVPAVSTKTTSGTSVPSGDIVPTFANNTSITSVEFEDNVEIENNNATCMFYGCTSLKRVKNIPNAAGGSASLCYGCTSLEEYPTFAKYGGSLNQAFRGCSKLAATADTIKFPPYSIKFGNMFRDCKKITSVPSIPSTAQEITSMFQNCTSLVTAGDICLAKGTLATSVFYGCTALKTVGKLYGDTITSIASLFTNCKSLEGIVRIECPNITTTTNAFAGVDLTKIVIQVPANSTTHTSLMAAYPSATFETF